MFPVIIFFYIELHIYMMTSVLHNCTSFADLSYNYGVWIFFRKLCHSENFRYKISNTVAV